MEIILWGGGLEHKIVFLYSPSHVQFLVILSYLTDAIRIEYVHMAILKFNFDVYVRCIKSEKDTTLTYFTKNSNRFSKS